jgi:hypothetical protein
MLPRHRERSEDAFIVGIAEDGAITFDVTDYSRKLASAGGPPGGRLFRSRHRVGQSVPDSSRGQPRSTARLAGDLADEQSDGYG